jgi:hypothetical protein
VFATHTCFDRHDAAFSVSNLQEQDDLSRRTVPIVRMQSCFNRRLITGRSTGVYAVPETGPQFRSERVQTGAQRTRRAPSPTVAGADPLAASVAPERSPRDKRSASKPHILTRPWFTWISGVFVTALAFTVVLWLTGPLPPPPGVSILASATVSDATSLMAAVQTAGLRGAPDVKGAIESITRIDDERVTIKGWAVDKSGSSPQLTIIAFAGGTHALTTVTNGPRKDIAQMFALSGAGARNVSFEASFACGPGQNLLVVAVSYDHTYSQFRSLACP